MTDQARDIWNLVADFEPHLHDLKNLATILNDQVSSKGDLNQEVLCFIAGHFLVETAHVLEIFNENFEEARKLRRAKAMATRG